MPQLFPNGINLVILGNDLNTDNRSNVKVICPSNHYSIRNSLMSNKKTIDTSNKK